MTPETAAGLLKHHINTWKGKFPPAHFEACELAIEALEKQNEKERRLLKYIRELQFGELVIKVQDGLPVFIERAKEKVKL